MLLYPNIIVSFGGEGKSITNKKRPHIGVSVSRSMPGRPFGLRLDQIDQPSNHSGHLAPGNRLAIHHDVDASAGGACRHEQGQDLQPHQGQGRFTHSRQPLFRLPPARTGY